MKAISAVIAVVLILMITVGLAAAAYVWFSGVFETITTGAGDVAEDTADVISTSFSIAAATRVSDSVAQVVIANTGSSNMNISKMNVIVNDQLAEKTTNSDTGILETGNVATIEVDRSGVYKGDFCNAQIKVVYSSLTREESLPECAPADSILILECPTDSGARLIDFIDNITVLLTPTTITTVSLDGLELTSPTLETVEFSKLSSTGTVLWTEQITSNCMPSTWCNFTFSTQSFEVGQILQIDNLRTTGLQTRMQGSCPSSNFLIESYYGGTEINADPLIRLYS